MGVQQVVTVIKQLPVLYTVCDQVRLHNCFCSFQSPDLSINIINFNIFINSNFTFTSGRLDAMI